MSLWVTISPELIKESYSLLIAFICCPAKLQLTMSSCPRLQHCFVSLFSCCHHWQLCRSILQVTPSCAAAFQSLVLKRQEGLNCHLSLPSSAPEPAFLPLFPALLWVLLLLLINSFITHNFADPWHGLCPGICLSLWSGLAAASNSHWV